VANSQPTQSLVTEGLPRGLPLAVPDEQLAPLPKLVYVELADYCNLSCTFCQRSTYVDAVGRGGFIEFEMLKKLEQPLRAAKYFGLSGRIGEPLLHPKLESILHWLYEINPEILLRITTNGTALGRKLAGLFAGHLDCLSISLNASNAQAYVRDMRPVGQHGADPLAWWNNLIRRISEFIAALPAADRGRVRVIAPVQRDNLDDMANFVRLAASMGCSRATFTVMQFHDDTNFGASVFWIKDRYNDVMDQIAALGAGLGVNVEAARFYTNPKPEKLDLDALCREPLESAYLNMEKLGTTAPCCHWSEEAMPMDVYSDSRAFERFWNSDTYRRLRRKRDFQSCKSCGMSRAFDEMSFHLTPSMKYILAITNWSAVEEARDVYPDSELVRACNALSLDLPKLRHTVLQLGVPVDDLYFIKRDGLRALPEIDRACWNAFIATDPPPVDKVDVTLGGCFTGIGWHHADNDPVAKISARWMGGGRKASVFVRVVPGYAYRLVVTAHHLRSPEMASGLNLGVGGQPLHVQLSLDDHGVAVLTAPIPKDLSSSHGGRLWLEIGYNDSHGHEGWVSFSRVEVIRVDEGLRSNSRPQEATPVGGAFVLR
jgi:MoaA/NifB/PqqE/SkfB family radical SAM enzyme